MGGGRRCRLMSARKLREPLRAYRIGDPHGRYPVYSGDGAALVSGRWHRKGQIVIYAAEHYSTALLETLVNTSGVLPPNQHFIDITIPAGTSYEEVTKDILPGWDAPASAAARRFGSAWLDERRTAILIVPSYVAPEEANVYRPP